MPPVGRADRGADCGDLVLGLERLHTERLHLRQLVEDVRGGGDGIAPVEEREAAEDRGGDAAQGGRFVSADVAVGASRHDSRGHAVLDAEKLRRLAEVVTGLQGSEVRFEDVRAAGELLGRPLDGGVHRPAVEPEDEAEGVEVPAAELVLRVEREAFERQFVMASDLDGNDLVGRERPVVEGVYLVGSLLEVGGLELVLIDDEEAAGAQVPDIRLERGRVHRDEHVRAVAGGVDVAPGEGELESGDTGG